MSWWMYLIFIFLITVFRNLFPQDRLTFFFIFSVMFLVLEITIGMRPNPKRVKKLPWIKGHYCHRGLYTKDQSISENSLGAFQKSVEAGYGIELDVQLSLDGKVYVFHDDDLNRMTGAEGLLEEKTSEELNQLRLIGSAEKIPLLSDVLDLVKGQVPMLVELKSTLRREEAVAAVTEHMRGYSGNYAYCSFDPLILKVIKAHAPMQLRGLNMEYSMDKKQFKIMTRIVLQYALLNYLITPDYLSVDYKAVPFVYKLWRLTGSFGMKWAVPCQEEEDKLLGSCETVIFEHYLPSQR